MGWGGLVSLRRIGLWESEDKEKLWEISLCKIRNGGRKEIVVEEARLADGQLSGI